MAGNTKIVALWWSSKYNETRHFEKIRRQVKNEKWSSFCGYTIMTISGKKCYGIALLRGCMRRTVIWVSMMIWDIFVSMPLNN